MSHIARHVNLARMAGAGDYPVPEPGRSLCMDCMGERTVSVTVHDDPECEPVQEKRPCPYCNGTGFYESDE